MTLNYILTRGKTTELPIPSLQSLLELCQKNLRFSMKVEKHMSLDKK